MPISVAEVHSAELQIQQGLQEFGVLYDELQYFVSERVCKLLYLILSRFFFKLQNNVKSTLQVTTQTIQAVRTLKTQFFTQHQTDECLFGLVKSWPKIPPKTEMIINNRKM